MRPRSRMTTRETWTRIDLFRFYIPPSRYVESDRRGSLAFAEFGGFTEDELLAAVSSWVGSHLVRRGSMIADGPCPRFSPRGRVSRLCAPDGRIAAGGGRSRARGLGLCSRLAPMDSTSSPRHGSRGWQSWMRPSHRETLVSDRDGSGLPPTRLPDASRSTRRSSSTAMTAPRRRPTYIKRPEHARRSWLKHSVTYPRGRGHPLPRRRHDDPTPSPM